MSLTPSVHKWWGFQDCQDKKVGKLSGTKWNKWNFGEKKCKEVQISAQEQLDSYN